MFTDSHCHLNFPELSANIAQIREAMAAAKVTRALCISTTMEEFPEVHQLALDYDNFWATVGVHPDTEDMTEPSVQDLVERAALPRVVAIGETGLDYYGMEDRKGGRTIADLEWQRERFRTHIRAAQITQKPLVIHTRSSSDDTLGILRECGEPIPAPRPAVSFTVSPKPPKWRVPAGHGLLHLPVGHRDLQECPASARRGGVRAAGPAVDRNRQSLSRARALPRQDQ
jgi:Tat protein secretion system quality control protein TatD with DNase activity